MKKPNNRTAAEIERYKIIRAAATQLSFEEIARLLSDITGKVGYRLLSSAVNSIEKENQGGERV